MTSSACGLHKGQTHKTSLPYSLDSISNKERVLEVTIARQL